MIFVIVHLEEVCNYVYLCSLSYVLQVSSFVALACASLYCTLQTVVCLAFQNHLDRERKSPMDPCSSTVYLYGATGPYYIMHACCTNSHGVLEKGSKGCVRAIVSSRAKPKQETKSEKPGE